ncbi:TetR/AcrR family transcriptional regulator [Vineibacter terrae]|uniref:TetR/AcrR family transcriptional regulator n=2 Tax=Vineibacter terrae TaxID=2586908 RepID=A0A5C8PT17_9HYPH|nr:TetR/AcrR family transcriptional regulator [Vineibacter terrae]
MYGPAMATLSDTGGARPRTKTAAARPRRTQAERRAESERRMLSAAADLIAQQGFGATTLEQIGTRAGYSRGLVNQRYGSKENMVKALVGQMHANFYRQAFPDSLSAPKGLPAICEVVDIYMQTFYRAGSAMRAYYVLMAESLGVIQEIRDTFVAATGSFRTRFEEQLRHAKRAGEVSRDLHVPSAATLILSLLTGVCFLWMISPESMDLRTLRRTAIKAVEHALKPPS